MGAYVAAEALCKGLVCLCEAGVDRGDPTRSASAPPANGASLTGGGR